MNSKTEAKAGAPRRSEEKKGEKKEGAKEGNGLRLTDRDRQLMGMLATVRCMTTGQIGRLLFAERNAINLEKRCLALAGIGKHGVGAPYLTRVSFRNWEGMPQTAWSLTPLGYTVAEAVLPTPPRRPTAEVGAAFIEHTLMLVEVYVQLLEGPLKQVLAAARQNAAQQERPSRSFTRVKAALYARASLAGFRWQSHDEVRLPWREPDKEANDKTRQRVIVPDATLELPGSFEVVGEPGWDGAKQTPGQVTKHAGRRFFLECETGSQTIVPEGDTKPGATVNKLDRYQSFFTRRSGYSRDEPTLYAAKFPDGFVPHVYFLVRTQGRADAVNAAIAQWEKKGDRVFVAKAFTAEALVARLRKLLRQTPPAAPAVKPGRSVVSAEVRLIRDYVTAAEAELHRVRVVAQGRREALPKYPANREQLKALLAKLTGTG